MKAVRAIPSSETAFPHRDRQFHALMIPIYSDRNIEEEAVRLGKDFRNLMRRTSGEGVENAVYMNFATGDERKEDLYGGVERLSRLRELKWVWDPRGRFNHYNPIY